MADWPDTAELKAVLDVTSDDWETTLGRVMAAAIDKVKADVGFWSEYEDEPDDNLSQAALRMAELMALRPEAAANVSDKDPTYRRLLFGHRRAFGIS